MIYLEKYSDFIKGILITIGGSESRGSEVDINNSILYTNENSKLLPRYFLTPDVYTCIYKQSKSLTSFGLRFRFIKDYYNNPFNSFIIDFISKLLSSKLSSL